jgi:hypothetical protein
VNRSIFSRAGGIRKAIKENGGVSPAVSYMLGSFPRLTEQLQRPRSTDGSTALESLVRDRLGAVNEALQRGDTGVGCLQNLHAVADTVEQIADSGTMVKRRSHEIVGRIVERGVDLVACGEIALPGQQSTAATWRTEAERTIFDNLQTFLV